MQFSITYLVLGIFFIAVRYDVKSESIEEFIDGIRNKIRHLEDTNQIKRDYEPYVEPELKDNEEYDFIIVGSGSSGSAIIHRLSEIEEWNILVLEAGGEPDNISDIPFFSPMVEVTGLNWKFLTEKEDNFGLGLQDHRMHWPRGKVLGGSSVLNYMVFSRGAKEDYDKWASLGNPGWSYKDLLPLFKKMETCNIKGKDKEFRGTNGPIFVEEAYRSKGAEIFVEAAKNAGYKFVDYNGHNHKGVSYTQGTIKRGLRCGGERCYIKPIKNRKNLTVRLHSHVTKIIIKNKTARGVEFVKNGKTYKVKARKEVVLSAGVINSAHILLLSGIGPEKQLQKFGIKPIMDLPVGQKIYDHPAYWGLGFTVNESINYDAITALKDESFKELYNKGEGILQDLGGVESLIFINTPISPTGPADIELIFYSNHFVLDPGKGFERTIRLSEELYEKMYKPYVGRNAVTCVVGLMHPVSFGHLELRSANPFDHPKIYGGYYTDSKGIDIKTMIAGIREAIRVMLLPPFDKYDIKLMDIPVVGCEKFYYDSDNYWECALRHLTSTIFHHTTTCKMGPSTDPEAVVDNRLRVYGIKNLRIADTSIIPIPITGHTNVPAFLVGEKAADIIKEEHLY